MPVTDNYLLCPINSALVSSAVPHPAASQDDNPDFDLIHVVFCCGLTHIRTMMQIPNFALQSSNVSVQKKNYSDNFKIPFIRYLLAKLLCQISAQVCGRQWERP